MVLWICINRVQRRNALTSVVSTNDHNVPSSLLGPHAAVVFVKFKALFFPFFFYALFMFTVDVSLRLTLNTLYAVPVAFPQSEYGDRSQVLNLDGTCRFFCICFFFVFLNLLYSKKQTHLRLINCKIKKQRSKW